MSGEAVRLIVKKMGVEAGLKSPVRPHGLRHQAITEALDEGHRLDHVMKFARHSNANTTLIYNDNRMDVAGMVARSIARRGR
jgi:integrase/recombinase XerC